MKFEYDKTYLPKDKCSLAKFREKVEEHRANGKPDCVEVLFFGDELVLVVSDIDNENNLNYIEFKP